ncbi:MAG: phosphatase PAP2 family protein [Chloroflexota bacterium]
MNDWLSWGIPIIVWLQGLGAWLTRPMEFFTFLGTEEFFMLVMPAVLWCFDAGLGLRLGLILLTSDAFNGAFKLIFGWPRPYWVSDQILALSAETSFGLPSGHAQNALALWGRLAVSIRRRWATVLLGLVILLISVSRLYLGVHFPSDVLAGWLVAGVLLWLFVRYDEPARRWLSRIGSSRQIVLALILSLVLLGLQSAVFQLTAGRVVPTAWAEQAAAAAPEADPIQPRSLEGMFSGSGVLFGLGAGGALLFGWGGFNPQGPAWKRIGRYLLGLAGVLALWMGLRAILPEGETALALALRYLRYAAVGLWVTYGAPRLFVWLRLA